jgi:DHA3 family macrolide efflux protein-like MFS transporter
MQGRVFTLVFSLTQALAPLGLLAAGPAADALGVGFWFVLTGSLIALVGAGAFFVPAIVHIEAGAGRASPLAGARHVATKGL